MPDTDDFELVQPMIIRKYDFARNTWQYQISNTATTVNCFLPNETVLCANFDIVEYLTTYLIDAEHDSNS